MLLLFPRDILLKVMRELELSDILRLSTLSRAHRSLLEDRDVWLRYVRMLNLDDSVVRDPFWDQLSVFHLKKFCSNYLNPLTPLRNRQRVEMLDVVVLIDDPPVLQQYCQERSIPWNNDLLERVAAYAPMGILTDLVEKHEIPITRRALLSLFTQRDIKVINCAIVYMYNRGVVGDQYFRTNHRRYLVDMLRDISKEASETAIDRLLDTTYGHDILISTLKFRNLAGRLRLATFDKLVTQNIIKRDEHLLNECAEAGRVDLVTSLLSHGNLELNESILGRLVVRGKLSDIEEFVNQFKLCPTEQDTLELAKKNGDIHVSEYIASIMEPNSTNSLTNSG